MAKQIGFIQYDNDKVAPKNKDHGEPFGYKAVLDAYFQADEDSGRWTSEEIHENVMDTMRIPINTINKYMADNGYHLVREDDRLVWTKDE